GLSEGDLVSVRVVRAAQGGKGPRLTARLAPHEVPPARGPGALLELALRFPGAAVLADDAALAARLRPTLGERVSVVPRAFDDEIEDELQALAESEVAVPGGALLHIHPTPALVAIDVDAGGAVASRHGKAAMHLATNEALLPAL